MTCLQAFLCVIFPPLAVSDKGCGTIAIIFLLTMCGWIPGIIGALIVTTNQQQIIPVPRSNEVSYVLDQPSHAQKNHGIPLWLLAFFILIPVLMHFTDKNNARKRTKLLQNPKTAQTISSNPSQEFPIQAEESIPIIHRKPGFVIFLKDSRELYYEKIEKSKESVTVRLDGGGMILYPMTDIKEIREIK